MSNDVTTSVPEQQPSQSTEVATDLSKPRIRRWEVVQALLDLYDRPSYLEVGVSKGGTFHQLKAEYKVAVDPRFQFDWEEERRRRGPETEYHQVTSDVYFGSIVDTEQQFDVIYLDGLHTFEQTLRDLTNALAHLAPRGVIVVDDVRPNSYHASLPTISHYQALRKYAKDERRMWMGDVYKLVWFIDTFYQSLNYATVGNNHGQAVIWRERRAVVTERSVAEIGTLSFEDFVLNRDVLKARPFGQIMDDLKGRIGRS